MQSLINVLFLFTKMHGHPLLLMTAVRPTCVFFSFTAQLRDSLVRSERQCHPYKCPYCSTGEGEGAEEEGTENAVSELTEKIGEQKLDDNEEGT